MNQEKFQKTIHQKTLLIVGIVFLGIAALICAGTYFLCNEEKKNAKSFQNIVSMKETKDLDYAYIDVEMMSEGFATIDDKMAYLVFDNNYAYIAVLNNKAKDSLKQVFDYSYDSDMEQPPAVRIHGMTQEIPNDLKTLAIEYYNELFEDTLLTETNFEAYIGTLYIDTHMDPVNSYGIVLFVLGGIVGLVGLIQIIVYITNERRTKKYLLKYQDVFETIQNDLDSSNTLYYKKQKLFLTNKHIVSMVKGMEIFEYKDILWIYPQDHYVNGIRANHSILIMTNDFKIHSLAILGFSKSQQALFDEIYNNVAMNLPNALKGFSRENEDKIKQMKKQQKLES